jgi:ornithine cyclodeaminase/alanine dehydrogenase-like protein (mu-crystallin family)
MAGWVGAYFGTKFYSSGTGGAHFWFYLFERATGRPLACIEANHLGQIRTGAATGVAAKRLSNPESHVLAVIGAGFQAQSQIEAVRAVRPIEEVRIFARTPEKRRNCWTAEEAVRGADIVVTATWSREPVIETSWLKPGAFVAAVGSNQPTRRELPADLIHQAAQVVADSAEACRVEAGDLLLAEADWARVQDLRDVSSGNWMPDGVTVFKSVGLGVEDTAVAGYLFDRIQSSEGS